jgi:hypothetical protein
MAPFRTSSQTGRQLRESYFPLRHRSITPNPSGSHARADHIPLRFDLLNCYTFISLHSFNPYRSFLCFEAAKLPLGTAGGEQQLTSFLPRQPEPNGSCPGPSPLQLRVLAMKSCCVLIGPRKRQQPRFPV